MPVDVIVMIAFQNTSLEALIYKRNEWWMRNSLLFDEPITDKSIWRLNRWLWIQDSDRKRAVGRVGCRVIVPEAGHLPTAVHCFAINNNLQKQSVSGVPMLECSFQMCVQDNTNYDLGWYCLHCFVFQYMQLPFWYRDWHLQVIYRYLMSITVYFSAMYLTHSSHSLHKNKLALRLHSTHSDHSKLKSWRALCFNYLNLAVCNLHDR